MSELDVVEDPAADTDAPPAPPSPRPPATGGEATAGVAEGGRPPAAGPAQRRRLVLYAASGAVAALALVALGLYAWKVVALGRLQGRFEAERAQSISAQRQALEGQARALLRLSARPLAWSVRTELLRGNLGQVDDYFRELVHERGVSSLLLVDKDGRIALATNRKLETQPAAAVVSKPLLDSAEVAVEESASTLRMAVPVMGFDRRIGTLVLDYEKSVP